MFTKIVVGVDGSECGRDALAFARTLADVTDSTVVAVHVYPRDPLGGQILGITGRPLREAVEELLDREAAAGPEGARMCAVADISVAHALQQVAEREAADLLIVGSTRHGAKGRILLGGIGRQTIEHAPCAVAVVPSGYAAGQAELRRIGVGYDGSSQARCAVEDAVGLAHATRAEICLLDAISPPFQGLQDYPYAYPIDWTEFYEAAGLKARAQLDRAVQAIGASAWADVRDAQPVEALVSLSGECDVLFIGSRHWGTPGRVMLGSTADGVVSQAHCPVIVTPMGVGGPDHESELAAVTSERV